MFESDNKHLKCDIHTWLNMVVLPPIPKPLHSDTVSVHFNHFYCTEICDKLRRCLYMLINMFLYVNDCWLTSSMSQQRFELQICLYYVNIEQGAFSWRVVNGHVSFLMVGLHITLHLPYNINNDRHSPVCMAG